MAVQTAAPLAWELNWATMISYCFFEARTSISWKSRTRSASSSGSQRKKKTWELLDTCESHTWFWDTLQPTSCFKNLGLDIALELAWVPGRAIPTDAAFTKQAAEILQFSHQPMPFPSRTCFVSHCGLRPVRRTNTGASSNRPIPSIRKPACA